MDWVTSFLFLLFFLSFFKLHTSFRSEKSPITAKRLEAIIEHLTFAVFEYTCRGLYEDHKFLFTLLLALKIDLSRDRVKHQVVSFSNLDFVVMFWDELVVIDSSSLTNSLSSRVTIGAHLATRKRHYPS